MAETPREGHDQMFDLDWRTPDWVTIRACGGGWLISLCLTAFIYSYVWAADSTATDPEKNTTKNVVADIQKSLVTPQSGQHKYTTKTGRRDTIKSPAIGKGGQRKGDTKAIVGDTAQNSVTHTVEGRSESMLRVVLEQGEMADSIRDLRLREIHGRLMVLEGQTSDAEKRLQALEPWIRTLIWISGIALALSLIYPVSLGVKKWRPRRSQSEGQEPLGEEESLYSSPASPSSKLTPLSLDPSPVAPKDPPWVETLKENLEKRVKGLTSSTLSPDLWNELHNRKEELRRWRDTLDEIKKEMKPEDQQGFGLMVEREVARPFQHLRDLITLRQITEKPGDPVLLLKAALLGEEMLSEAALENLLRRTQPGQMVRYFLPGLNAYLSHRGQKGLDVLYQALSPLCGTEIELVIARPGEAFDIKRHHIVSQETTGAQPRDRIVQCMALGLRDIETGTIEPKAKIVISG